VEISDSRASRGASTSNWEEKRRLREWLSVSSLY